MRTLIAAVATVAFLAANTTLVFAGTCHTTCYWLGNQQHCTTTCF